MPICPRCSEEIRSLKVTDVHQGELVIGEDDRLQAVDYTETSEQSFFCPKCGQKLDTLTNQPDLATKFLKTGKMF
jgi:hypothetical protein